MLGGRGGGPGLGGTATHSHLAALSRWHTEPGTQQVLVEHSASRPHAAVPPHGSPVRMVLAPEHRPSAAVGVHHHLAADWRWHCQPAGQQVPWYCASLHRWGEPSGQAVPPHCAHCSSRVPAGQVALASQVVAPVLSEMRRLPSRICSACGGRPAPRVPLTHSSWPAASCSCSSPLPAMASRTGGVNADRTSAAQMVCSAGLSLNDSVLKAGSQRSS